MKKNILSWCGYLFPILLIALIVAVVAPKVIGRGFQGTKKEAACWQRTTEVYGGRSSQDIDLILDAAIEEYKQLVEQSLVYRVNAITMANRLKKITEAAEPISGRDLDELNRGMIHMVSLRKELLTVAYSHACWPAGSQKIFRQAGVDSLSPETQLRGMMLSLSASLLLYDNYLLMIAIFEEDEKLRRFLNDKDSGYAIDRNELKKATKNFISHRNRKFVRNAIEIYEQQKQDMPATFSANDNISYLETLIELSPSYQHIIKSPRFFLTGHDIKFISEATGDTIHDFSENSFDLVSKFFGNSVGIVATRKGRLYGDGQALQRLKATLKPGDILLEKTPFRLTDKLIPGHWGHVAIWVGTEAELRSLGLWDHPLISQYHHKIQNGHSVIEALRSGVEINKLELFVNVDDLAVLRKIGLTEEVLKERLVLAFRQIGKEYDFNFDVETTNKIVCSELIYTVFLDMQWPTENALGRHTISPDNVASKTLLNGPLKLITLYHKGKLVEDNPQKLMEELLRDQ